MAEGLSQDEREVLLETLERRRKEESFEHGLGRELRRKGLDFEAYVRLISLVRERAGKERQDLYKVTELWLQELTPDGERQGQS